MIEAERHYQGGAGRGRAKSATPTEQMSLKDAYNILNVNADSSDAEIKKAYRRLLSQHHPDKLVSKGLPEEMMKMAAQKTHEIRKAYEKVKDKRGF